MKTSESILKISGALLDAQKVMGDATKQAKNPFFKSSYADLNSIREAAIPVLNAVGISVLQPTVEINGEAWVETLLLHESGEFITSQTKIVYAKEGDPQAQGSGLSYARRYGLQSLLNIGAVDDDGEKAMVRTAPSKSAYTAPTKLEVSGPPVSLNTSILGTAVETPAAPKKSSSFKKKSAAPVAQAVAASQSAALVTAAGDGTAKFPAVSTSKDGWQ